MILTEIAGRELLSSQHDYYAPLASPLVKRLFLNLTSNGGEVQLALYPGDTLSQARVLYHRQDVLDRLRALGAQPGWAVSPNFHFGYVGKGMCWPSGPLGLDGYIELFKQRIDDEYELHADDWDAYWAKMVELGVFDPTYRDEFDAWFTNTNRRSASPRPGLAVTRHWPLDEAEGSTAHTCSSARSRPRSPTPCSLAAPRSNRNRAESLRSPAQAGAALGALPGHASSSTIELRLDQADRYTVDRRRLQAPAHRRTTVASSSLF